MRMGDISRLGNGSLESESDSNHCYSQEFKVVGSRQIMSLF